MLVRDDECGDPSLVPNVREKNLSLSMTLGIANILKILFIRLRLFSSITSLLRFYIINAGSILSIFFFVSRETI